MPVQYESVEELIENENGHMPTAPDQKILHRKLANDGKYASDDEKLRTREVNDKYNHFLDHDTDTILENLEKIDVVTKFDPPGTGTFIRNERTDAMFFTPDEEGFRQCLHEEQDRLIEDLEPIDDLASDQVSTTATDGGEVTRREVVAKALEVPEQSVEDALLEPADIIEQMTRFDNAVGAIEDHERVEKDGDYGAMGWRNMANRWAVSEFAEKVEDYGRVTEFSS